jgi:Holliday junction resolvase
MKSEGMKASQSHEKRLAKVIDGSRVAASGAFWSRKGDVRSERYLIEHKYTAKKSYSIKAEDLQKLEKEAIMVGREPLFCISLGGKNYVLQTEDDFIAMAGL